MQDKKVVHGKKKAGVAELGSRHKAKGGKQKHAASNTAVGAVSVIFLLGCCC